MPPGPPPNSQPVPGFPDPGLIDALAGRWVAGGAALDQLAEVLHEVVGGMDWAGEGYQAAVTAAAGVAQVVRQAGDDAVSFGRGVQKDGAAVREAIKQAKKEFWAEIFTGVFTVLTFGIGTLLSAGIIWLAGIFSGVGMSVGAAAFLAGSFVLVPVMVGIDLGSQLVGEALGGLPRHVNPDMIPADVVMGLLGGLGVARSEEPTSELQSHLNLVSRLLLAKKNRRSSSSC